mmetsp:Transcript_14193/g.39036  ORF Transcript_14193/g.39036 Transcript_14193/m.39036 type:complete len:236 (+) Transcript_14193:37-744(+)
MAVSRLATRLCAGARAARAPRPPLPCVGGRFLGSHRQPLVGVATSPAAASRCMHTVNSLSSDLAEGFQQEPTLQQEFAQMTLETLQLVVDLMSQGMCSMARERYEDARAMSIDSEVFVEADCTTGERRSGQVPLRAFLPRLSWSESQGEAGEQQLLETLARAVAAAAASATGEVMKVPAAFDHDVKIKARGTTSLGAKRRMRVDSSSSVEFSSVRPLFGSEDIGTSGDAAAGRRK